MRKTYPHLVVVVVGNLYVACKSVLFVSAGKSDETGSGNQKKKGLELELAKLESVCAGLHRQVINVPLDGNCLFSALAVHLTEYHAADEPASRIRADLVAYLRKHRNIVRNLIIIHSFIT